MDLLTFATRELALGSLILLIGSAMFVCWKSRSLHPIKLRLLRIFVTRQDVKDSTISKSLDDESAVVSFRLAHGIDVRTLADAKKVAAFAAQRNIPLDLIGRAGIGFDLGALRLKSKEDAAWWVQAGLFLAALLLTVLTSLAISTALSSSMIVTIKATGAKVWLDQTEAIIQSPLYFGEEIEFSKASCNGKAPASLDTSDGRHVERTTLCEVWQDSALDSFLEKGVKKQRRTYIILSFLGIAYTLLFVMGLRQLTAQSKLRKMLSSS